jgi:hypothetical protein
VRGEESRQSMDEVKPQNLKNLSQLYFIPFT